LVLYLTIYRSKHTLNKMKSSSALFLKAKELNFNFTTTYLGKEITLNIISNNEIYDVRIDNEIIGAIKLGVTRHTWYVINSHFIPAYLVDAIGNQIEFQLLTT
jgi:hypothetical protein